MEHLIIYRAYLAILASQMMCPWRILLWLICALFLSEDVSDDNS